MAVSRKTVTVLFADVADSTGLGERLDPESVRGALGRWFEVAREVIESHGGTVEKFIGDAVMAVFGIPQLHEDDAFRAVRAGDELRRAAIDLTEELERERGVRLTVRVGVNTGEVVAGDATQRLLRELGRFEPMDQVIAKGKSEPVYAWRLIEIDRDGARFA